MLGSFATGTFDLTESDTSDDDHSPELPPPPPPRDDRDDDHELPPPPPPPRRSKAVPKVAPLPSGTKTKTKSIPPPPPLPFAPSADRRKPSKKYKSVPPPPPLAFVPSSDRQKASEKRKRLIAGAILALALVIGCSVGLTQRNTPTGTSISGYDNTSNTATGFEPFDNIPGPTNIGTNDGNENNSADNVHPDDSDSSINDDSTEISSNQGPKQNEANDDDETRVANEPDGGQKIVHTTTIDPTATPTSLPTQLPISPTSIPTNLPTNVPTFPKWLSLPEPNDPDDSYFNYNLSSKYGPNGWKRTKDARERKYWEEYERWIEPDLGNNMCNSGSDRQSPIDLSFDIVNAECFEYHQIKDKPGFANIDDDSIVRFEIHPSKLRINYFWASEHMGNMDTEGYVVPSADIPKGWGIHLPVLHVDIKMPSEHTLNGKRYAAEYQVFLIQNKDAQRGAPAVSVFFDLHPDDVPNQTIQIVLDRFQRVWDDDYSACNRLRKGGRDRGLSEEEDGPSVREENTIGTDHIVADAESNRELQAGAFNPWHPAIIRSAWFFGYEGSLTEPPCTEFVEWRIIDVPALISKDQLGQMQTLLFGHIDSKCKETSVHYNGSVARPIQPSLGREVHKCMCRDYLGNGHRKWYGRNRCWEGDEHIFHEKDSKGNWVTNPATRPDRYGVGVWNCWHDETLLPPCCGRSYDPFHECCAEGTC